MQSAAPTTENSLLSPRNDMRQDPSIAPALTLLEILLSVALAALLAGIISLLIGMIWIGRGKAATISEVEQQGRDAMNTITQSARNADTIVSPAVGATSTSLTLTLFSPSLSPATFDVSSGVLRVAEGSSSPISITNSRIEATNVIFHNVSRSGTPGAIRITYTLRFQNDTGRNEYDYEKTFISTASLR